MPSRRDLLAGVTSLVAAGAAGCLDATDSTSPGSDADTDWPVAGYDPFGTAYVADGVAPREDPDDRWRADLDGSPIARPVVADGTVFQTTMAGIEAFDAASGEKRWTFRRAGHDAAVWYPPPAVHDGIVYIGAGDALVAVDAETSQERWAVDAPSSFEASPVPDGDWEYLFAGTNAGRVLRVTRDGDVDWSYDVFGGVSRLVSAGRSVVTVGTTGGEVYQLYDARGLWRRKVPGQVTALTGGRGNSVFVATFGGGVLELQTGAHAGRAAWHAEHGPVAHRSLVHAGEALYGADGAGLTRVDADDGGRTWTLGDDYFSAPAAAGDTVYVGGEGEVAGYPLSGGVGLGGTRAGARRWRRDLGDGVVSGVSVAQGALFVPVDGREHSKTELLALE